MQPVRFVHAADLHLDAPFQGVDASDVRVRAALVASTYEALDRIVALCETERADFLVIAGDVYNSRQRSARAQFAFQAAMERLAGAGIPVFIAQGNHDPADGWSLGLRLPETVHHFSARRVQAIPFQRDGETLCTLYGRGYEHAAETRPLAKEFSRGPGDRVAIGVLHTNVGGRTDYENYAPASMDDLRTARMDYWALGHIHKPGMLSTDPAIVYAGCPQGLTPNEDGPRGCYVVEIAGGTVSAEFRPTCSVVWAKREVDVSDCAGIDDVRSAIREACDALTLESEGLPVVARVDLVGRTEAHGALTRAAVFGDLTCELRESQLQAEPWVWLDRLLDRTSATHDIAQYREAQDFAGDLVRLADEIGEDPERLGATLAAVLGPVETSVGELDLGATACELLARARDVCLDELEEDGSR
jgi:DNA repair protein SbcD/Mre11